MIVGVTGHQDLRGRGESIRTALAEQLPAVDAVCSSLAAGADQLVARLLVDRGAGLDVVVPCRHYESTLTGPALSEYRDLVRLAGRVTTLPYPKPSEEAFLAAGLVLVERCDLLVAVWDGAPAQGLGGTGDIVQYAEQRGRTIMRCWPSPDAQVRC